MYLLTLVLAFLSIGTISAYQIDPNLKFSEMVETLPIGIHFENLTIHHPFYEEIANGSLPLVKFQVMTQQDDLYVQNIFWALSKLAQREEDPGRKEFLERIGSGNWDPYFQSYYDKFNFSKAVQFLPTTLDYSATQYKAAKYEHIGVALATLYPCYTVWAKMGEHINKLANLENNPYKEFIETNNAGMGSSIVQEFIEFVNGYYDRSNNTALKRKMLDAYIRSIELEYAFANANYEAEAVETVPPPKFTDLYETLNPKIQEKIVHHSIFEELAQGTLPLPNYTTLIQQVQMYLKSYYRAFFHMEAKEGNFTRKSVLLKDGSEKEQWFQNQFDYHGFGSAVSAEAYTEGYTSLTLNVGERGTVLDGLAVTYPYKNIWNKIGQYIVELANLEQNPNHIYKEFIINHDPANSNTNLSNFKELQELINEYYDESHGDLEIQHRIFEIARQGILHELQFVNGVYGSF